MVVVVVIAAAAAAAMASPISFSDSLKGAKTSSEYSSHASTVELGLQRAPEKNPAQYLPGTVYLISSEGRMLELPIPSESPDDPLGWSLQKRAANLVAIMLFLIVGMTSLIAPGSLLTALSKDPQILAVRTAISVPAPNSTAADIVCVRARE